LYDPTQPRQDASDIHYSDAYGQFTGPDGFQYIWCYLPGRNEWVVARQDLEPQIYAAILALNSGCAPGCGCSAGDE
jgi:hypothetical protein